MSELLGVPQETQNRAASGTWLPHCAQKGMNAGFYRSFCASGPAIRPISSMGRTTCCRPRLGDIAQMQGSAYARRAWLFLAQHAHGIGVRRVQRRNQCRQSGNCHHQQDHATEGPEIKTGNSIEHA